MTCGAYSIFIQIFGQRLIFGPARFCVADSRHPCWIRHCLQRFNEGFQSFFGNEISQSFVLSGDRNDRILRHFQNARQVRLCVGNRVGGFHKMTQELYGLLRELAMRASPPKCPGGRRESARMDQHVDTRSTAFGPPESDAFGVSSNDSVTHQFR